MSFEYSSNFHCYKLIEAYREQLDFIRKEGELLVVEVILEIDINWSQCLRHITLLVSADQLQRKAITCTHIFRTQIGVIAFKVSYRNIMLDYGT